MAKGWHGVIEWYKFVYNEGKHFSSQADSMLRLVKRIAADEQMKKLYPVTSLLTLVFRADDTSRETHLDCINDDAFKIYHFYSSVIFNEKIIEVSSVITHLKYYIHDMNK